jgi:hypothetical protein
MALIIKTTGEEIETTPENKKDGFSSREIHAVVGGYFELVYATDGRMILLNEEGKLEGLAMNEKATALYGNPNDYIVGDVLVCDDKELK